MSLSTGKQPTDEGDVVAPPTVTAEVTVGDGNATGRQHRTSLHLSWHAVDPLAVHLLLTAVPDHPALPRGRWTMLRDFLRYGLSHSTGDGDVRVRPRPGGDGIELQLWRDGRCTTAWVPAETVCDFLDATEAIVPAGEEQSAAALDALIARLTRA